MVAIKLGSFRQKFSRAKRRWPGAIDRGDLNFADVPAARVLVRSICSGAFCLNMPHEVARVADPDPDPILMAELTRKMGCWRDVIEDKRKKKSEME
jgi:hypothetical protein